MLSEALWGLAAAGGAAVAGTVATDVWRSVRLRFAAQLGQGRPARERVEPTPAESGRLDHAAMDIAGAAAAERETGHRPRSRRTCVQHNISRDGGTQHITLSGDVNVGRESLGPR